MAYHVLPVTGPENRDTQYAIVDFTPELRQHLQALRALHGSVKAQALAKSLESMTFSHWPPGEFVGSEFLTEDEDQKFAVGTDGGVHMALDLDEFDAALGVGDFEKRLNEKCVSTDFCRLYINGDGFYWRVGEKYTEAYVETCEVSWKDLDEMELE